MQILKISTPLVRAGPLPLSSLQDLWPGCKLLPVLILCLCGRPLLTSPFWEHFSEILTTIDKEACLDTLWVKFHRCVLCWCCICMAKLKRSHKKCPCNLWNLNERKVICSLSSLKLSENKEIKGKPFQKCCHVLWKFDSSLKIFFLFQIVLIQSV